MDRSRCTMKQIQLSKLRGATDAGVSWMICSGCTDKEARDLAALMVDDLKQIDTQLQDIPKLDSVRG